ncbi:MAG: hypothetical protein U1F61_13025 [Opitutaceae bacterium]
MLADNPKNIQSGRLQQDIHLKATAKLELVSFIAQELPRWRDDPQRPRKSAETTLTEHLCDHLNTATYFSNNWSHVQFRTETGDEAQPGRKIDLTPKPRAATLVIEGRRHTHFDSLFPIECKRLPTPAEKYRDEREYVITESGTTGGIQRFKFGLHGGAHEFAAMIAFVQNNSFSHWTSQVNAWIGQLAEANMPNWSMDDQLRTVTNTGEVLISESNHFRDRGLARCDLRHVWVKMN